MQAERQPQQQGAGGQAVVHFNAFGNGAPLSAAEREHFFEIVEASLQVRRTPQFFLWTQGPLQRLVPHDILVFGAATGNGTSVSFEKLSSTRYFGEQHFADVCRPGQGLMSRMMSTWTRFGTPLLLSPVLRTFECHEDWLALAQAQELKNVAAHGVRSAGGRVATYFSFSRVGTDFGPRLYHRLALLVP